MQKSPSRRRLRKSRKVESPKREGQKKRRRFLPSFNFNSQPQTPNIKTRLLIVWGVLVAAGLGLGMNLYNLQIVQGPKLKEKARNQQMVNLRPFVPRRQIIDRNRTVLAIDRPVYTVYAHPKLFNKSNQEIAKLLAPIVD
ncbi:cell division protein FtsI, partial [Fischerella thermalis CCMEE 5328]